MSETDHFIESILAEAKKYIPETIIISGLQICKSKGNLYDMEASSILRAVTKRKREYTAGRSCARDVLAQLGVRSCPIPTGPNREPVWPCQITGSITHDGEYCVVAAAKKNNVLSLGLDVTLLHSMDGLASQIVTPHDRIDIAVNGSLRVIDPVLLAFSLKESIYKCLFPLVQRFFDFKDVAVLIDSKTAIVEVKLLNQLVFQSKQLDVRAAYFHAGTYILTIAWLL